MTQPKRHPMTTRPVVHAIPGMDAVLVRRDLPYGDGGDSALTIDLYAPPDAASAPRPAVVFVSGYPDPGFERMLGCKLKDMAGYTSWARLVAASGLVDRDGSTAVADAAAQFGFAAPPAGVSIDDIPPEPALLVVRAGRDEMPGLNGTIDEFVTAALARNLPITIANHAAAPHAFDLMDDTDASREVIRGILAFLRFHLLRP